MIKLVVVLVGFGLIETSLSPILDNKSSILAQNVASGTSTKMQYSQKLQISKQRGTRFWGVIQLNEFGSYKGAPGGAGEPPRNKF